MIINEEGTYTLRYTATDECGKSSSVDRELVVTDNSPRRTVLYTDGTFIINEKQTDEAHNIELHGAATNVYDPLDENHNYVFATTGDRPWNNQKTSVLRVEIGSKITPTSTNYWFDGMNNMTSFDATNLDTSNVTNMSYMFGDCSSITNLDLSSFNTSNVADMSFMFYDCDALVSLNVSSFDTHNVQTMRNMFNHCLAIESLELNAFNTGNVTNMLSMFERCSSLKTLDMENFNTQKVTTMERMFASCGSLLTLDLASFNTSLVSNMEAMFRYDNKLEKIFASSLFIVSQVTSSSNMFGNMSNLLVGGSGTVWNQYAPLDKTRAKIDGGTSDPGYFTAKA